MSSPNLSRRHDKSRKRSLTFDLFHLLFVIGLWVLLFLIAINKDK